MHRRSQNCAASFAEVKAASRRVCASLLLDCEPSAGGHASPSSAVKCPGCGARAIRAGQTVWNRSAQFERLSKVAAADHAGDSVARRRAGADQSWLPSCCQAASANSPCQAASGPRRPRHLSRAERIGSARQFLSSVAADGAEQVKCSSEPESGSLFKHTAQDAGDQLGGTYAYRLRSAGCGS